MSEVSFESGMSKWEDSFLTFKRDFGFSYEKQSYVLSSFDRHCAINYPDRDHLDKEMVMSWAVMRPTETDRGFRTRITVIRQFGKYLSMMGEKAFILPDNLRGRACPEMQYVFTPESLREFFGYTDSMERCYRSCNRHLVAPMMFRFMYCCGLRPGEARRLEYADINLDNGRIFIRESKHYKERVIYATDDLMQLTQEYISCIKRIYPESSALFVDRKGGMYTYENQKFLFEHCREQSGIRGIGTREPSLYSFRHTFATYRIYQWCKEGKDLGAMLPGLSEYMGHSSYVHTLYYLHLVPEIFTERSGIDLERFSAIIPEVPRHD